MVATGSDDELGNARAELRQLRELIDVLRTELERGQTQLAAERQRTVAQEEHDRRQARESLEAMRAALNVAHEDAAAALDAKERAFRAERAQLHEIIKELRTRLETSDVG